MDRQGREIRQGKKTWAGQEGCTYLFNRLDLGKLMPRGCFPTLWDVHCFASSSEKLKPLFFHFGLHCGSVYLGKWKENDVPLLSRQHDTVRTCHLTARMSHLPAILDCNRTGLLGCQRNDQRTSALKHNRIRAYPTVVFAGTLASCFQLVLADSQCWSTTSFKVNAAIT